jgi:hypothetical protein
MLFCYVHRLVQVQGQAGQTLNRSIGSEGLPPHGEDVLNYMFWHIERPGFSWGNMGSCTLMARIAILKKIGSFDPQFRRGAEWDAAIRLAQHGGYFISVDKPLIIQHITPTQDKAGKAPLKYAVLLRRKYATYLKKRHGYLAALACAYSRFYYAQDMIWYSRVLLLAACATAPQICLKEQVRRKFGKLKSIKIIGPSAT